MRSNKLSEARRLLKIYLEEGVDCLSSTYLMGYIFQLFYEKYKRDIKKEGGYLEINYAYMIDNHDLNLKFSAKKLTVPDTDSPWDCTRTLSKERYDYLLKCERIVEQMKLVQDD